MPARYCAMTSAPRGPQSPSAPLGSPWLSGRCQAAAFALRLIPDFLDEALMALHAELNHHIDQQIQQSS